MTGRIYADHAGAYWAAGWRGILPLPARRKFPPPTDWTGHTAPYPSWPDVQAWADGAEGAGNLALRLPPDVLGLDVDNYAGKTGSATIAELTAQYGPAPAAPYSTSRDDGSGIRLYRVPEGHGWRDNLPSVEIIHRGHRYVVAAPSVHPEGRPYRWVAPDGRDLDGPPSPTELPELPAAWVAGLARPARTATPADLADEEVRAWLDALPPGPPCRLVADTLARALEELRSGSSRHNAQREPVGRLVRWGERGHRGVTDALGQLRTAFLDSVAADRGRGPESEWARSLTGAVRLVVGDPTPEYERGCRCADGRKSTSSAGAKSTSLVEFVAQLRGWLDLPDPGHVLLTLAAAATRNLAGEPVWMLLVAPPSSGKTETVGLLGDVADGRLNEVSAAGLLGWSKGKTSVPTGLLARVGPRALVTFGDLSSLLATSDRGGRDQVFGMLRAAYDGHAPRNVAPPSKTVDGNDELSWTGRLTVVAAVTGAIDRYSSHADALGARWVQCRLPGRNVAAKRRAAALARGGRLAEHRGEARQAAAKLIAEAAGRVENVVVPVFVEDAVEDAAIVTCWGRAAVPRHGYGKREIDGVPVLEEPPRLVRQLLALARGLLALGLPPDYVTILVRRTALDSMPDARRAVLAALALGEALTTAALGRAAGLHRHVARMTAEELEAVGVVHGQRLGGDDEEDDRRTVTWQLDGDDGDLIADVFRAQQRSRGWHETWELLTPPPKKKR